MTFTWWQRLPKRKATRSSQGSYVHLWSKGYRRLQLERLESRLAPATHTWTGVTSALWSVDTNWNGGSPAGDPNAALVFPGSAANLSNTNDLNNLTIQSITFSGSANSTIGGNGLTLNGGGITLDITATTGTDMINLPITLGAIQTWTVTNASRTLQVAGVIDGTAVASLTKGGMGTLVLTGDNTYSGPTTIAAGSLLVNGSQPGSNVIINSGASLGGSGTVGTITANGAIIPGGPGPGILNSGNVVFNSGSSLVVGLAGTTPGTEFSQLNITGTANLAGSPTLTATVGSFVPTSGSTFTPITTTAGITGTFNGLANNSTLSVSGRNFSVNYQTNALVLTATTVNTQTLLTSSANPSVLDQPITLTATVAGVVPAANNVKPTGTVTFLDGTNTLGTATLSSDGTATFTTTAPLSAGTHPITAVYSGDDKFATSTSAILTQRVTGTAATTITLTSSLNPSVFSQPVTLTATVTAVGPATGTPTGTVTFKDGMTTLGTGTLDNNGRATFQTSTLTFGTHTITATYSGDTNFTTSTTSTALTQTVNRAASTTALASSQNPAAPGQQITFTATESPVSPATGTPTGTVTFNDGTTTLGTAPLSGGQATFSTSSLSAGTHSITAVYSGDNNFTGSTSLTLVQTISQSSTLNQNYVTQLYRDLLGRQPDSGGFTFWTGLLNQNQATPFLVSMGFVTSPEFRTLEVQDVYTQFLHRNADPIGLNGWTQYLLQGNTLEQLEAQIVASPEYLQMRAGGNTNNFLATLFMDAFNRPLDQAGRDMYGGDPVSSNGDRRRLAEKIFASAEFRQDLVQGYYQRYLNRSADPGGLNAATTALMNGMADETVIAYIVGSPEYQAKRVQ